MQRALRRIRYLLQSLRRHGPGHVVEVFRQEAVRRRYARSPVPLPSLDDLLNAHGASDVDAFVATFARNAARRLPMAAARRKEFFTGLLERTQGYDAILEEAERFSEGRFLALGITTLEPGGAYDWHRDYGSQRVWERAPFDRVGFMSGDGSDVKFPWELSRFYWIGWLGKAYWISGNGAWSRDFARQIDSWREANPVNIGVNWAMPMEVGIRAFWLVMGFGLFHGAPNIDAAWWAGYLQLAWAHGTYLENNLEYFSNLTNHYIANCFGLVSIGALFADSVKGRGWLEEGRRRLEREIEHQVLADGTHYERSLPYHRLVLEMYLIAAVLLERSGLPFSRESLAAIERMSVLLCDVMLPDGSIPQIGDADDGVILRTIQERDLYDARDVAAIAAALFRSPAMKAAAGAFTQGAVMLLGAEGYEAFQGIGGARAADSRLYPDGGFAVLRRNGLTIVADVGPIGLHGNNDTLSWALADEVAPIIIDPGTYCYTRSERLRNELRSTAAHNAPAVGDREIAEFDGLWRVRADRTAPEVIEWSAERSTLRARHSGYREIGVTVERAWRLDEEMLTVEDTVHGGAGHDVAVRFTLAPTIEVELLDERRLTLLRDGAAIGDLECSVPVSVERGWYSPSYGVAAATTLLVVRLAAAEGSGAAREISYIYRLRTPDSPRAS